MNSTEAAQVLAALHGAYPNQHIDEAVAKVWGNALANTDFDVAIRAVEVWIGRSMFWPKVAELNGVIREIRLGRRDTETPSLEAARDAQAERVMRCDGSGYIDRGDGMEPCPACNPWMRDVWREGDWNNTRLRAPADTIMPRSCRRAFTIEDGIVTDRDLAVALLVGGLNAQLAESGRTIDDLDPDGLASGLLRGLGVRTRPKRATRPAGRASLGSRRPPATPAVEMPPPPPEEQAAESFDEWASWDSTAEPPHVPG